MRPRHLHPLGAGRASADGTGLAEGEHPAAAVEGRNDFGEEGYGGPLPPVGHGLHRYVFRVFATSAPLGLVAGASRRPAPRPGGQGAWPAAPSSAPTSADRSQDWDREKGVVMAGQITLTEQEARRCPRCWTGPATGWRPTRSRPTRTAGWPRRSVRRPGSGQPDQPGGDDLAGDGRGGAAASCRGRVQFEDLIRVLQAEGIGDRRVPAAFRAVPRACSCRPRPWAGPIWTSRSGSRAGR